MEEHKRIRAQRGIGLIETGIALVVVMLAALGLSNLFVDSLRTSAQAEARLEALSLAEDKLETLRTFITASEFDSSVVEPASPDGAG